MPNNIPPDEYPLNGIGPRFQQASIGRALVRFHGSGLVATIFGMPGVGATRSVTGIVNITFQKSPMEGTAPNLANGMFIGAEPQLAYPTLTGTPDVHVGNVNSHSGTAELYSTKTLHPGVIASNNPTSYASPVNMPSGMQVLLTFQRSPVSAY